MHLIVAAVYLKLIQALLKVVTLIQMHHILKLQPAQLILIVPYLLDQALLFLDKQLFELPLALQYTLMLN